MVQSEHQKLEIREDRHFNLAADRPGQVRTSAKGGETSEDSPYSANGMQIAPNCCSYTSPQSAGHKDPTTYLVIHQMSLRKSSGFSAKSRNFFLKFSFRSNARNTAIEDLREFEERCAILEHKCSTLAQKQEQDARTIQDQKSTMRSLKVQLRISDEVDRFFTHRELPNPQTLRGLAIWRKWHNETPWPDYSYRGVPHRVILAPQMENNLMKPFPFLPEASPEVYSRIPRSNPFRQSRVEYRRAVEDFQNLGHVNVIYEKVSYVKDKWYSATIHRIQTRPDGTPIESTRQALCDNCEGVHFFYLLGDQSYSEHKFHHHGITKKGNFLPNLAFYGKDQNSDKLSDCCPLCWANIENYRAKSGTEGPCPQFSGHCQDYHLDELGDNALDDLENGVRLILASSQSSQAPDWVYLENM